jgi:hypothetical protein
VSEETTISCDNDQCQSKTSGNNMAQGWFQFDFVSRNGGMFMPKLHFCSIDCLKEAPRLASERGLVPK